MPTPTHTDPDAADKQFQLASDYFSKNLVTQALAENLKAIQLNPNNHDAHNLMGLISLRKAADSEEIATRAQCLKGPALRLEEEEMDRHFKKAEEEFKKAVEINPNFSDAWNNLSVTALHFKRWDDAIGYAEKALSNVLFANPFTAHGNLGQAYYEKRDYLRAQKALRDALFQQPKFCVGQYRLAKVYYAQKEYAQAADQLRQVIENKECPIQEAFHLAGVTALRLEDATTAREMFSKCKAMAPKSCVAHDCP